MSSSTFVEMDCLGDGGIGYGCFFSGDLRAPRPEDVDDDGSGTIGYEEFLKMMTHKILNRDPKDEPWR